MDMGLANRVAIVCAASKGLGYAIAEALAAEGATVVMCARSELTLFDAASRIGEATGASVHAVVADVSKKEDCERLVRETIATCGKVDILVTNTGGPAPGNFEDLDDAAWSDAVNNTLMNVVHLVRGVTPSMKEHGWGRIVHVTSITAREPIAGLTISNTLRPGLLGLSKDLSDDLAPHGILVNCVCPGLHATDRLVHVAQGESETETKANLEKMASSIPVGRLGQPEELAAAAVFLCSERASFITGTTLVVDGGAGRGVF